LDSLSLKRSPNGVTGGNIVAGFTVQQLHPAQRPADAAEAIETLYACQGIHRRAVTLKDK
jgi:hypothetical protein